MAFWGNTESFMEPEIVDANGALEVECEGGTFFVPAEYATLKNGEYDVSDYRPEMVTGEVIEIRTLTKGYLGRLSAAGYLDCTDWTYDTNKAKLLRELKS